MTNENLPPSESDNRALEPDQIVPPAPRTEPPALTGQPIQQLFYPVPVPYPQPASTHQTIVIQQALPPANSLGVVGFVFSILGFLSCGISAFIGFPMSLVALFKAPRGLAIAGSILSAAQIGFIVIFGLGPIAAGIAGLIGMGAIWSKVSGDYQQYNTTTTQFESAFEAIEKERETSRARPSEDKIASIISEFHDGWGRPFVYEQDVFGDGFSLRSIGEDNKPKTSDDRTMSLASYRLKLLAKQPNNSAQSAEDKAPN